MTRWQPSAELIIATAILLAGLIALRGVFGGEITIAPGYTPPSRYAHAREHLQRAADAAREGVPVTISVGVPADREEFLAREAEANGWRYVALPKGFKYRSGATKHHLSLPGVYDIQNGRTVKRGESYVPLPPLPASVREEQ